jgi:hypothetical protein
LDSWSQSTAGFLAPDYWAKLFARVMNQTLPAETGGTDITRFNALRHGLLSRYTILPWESTDEYQAVVEALVAEHRPQGRQRSTSSRRSPASFGASAGFAWLRLPRTGAGWRAPWRPTARR